MKKTNNVKKIAILSLALLVAFGTNTKMLTSSKIVDAAVTMPDGARPVQQSGIVFGGTGYELTQSNMARSNNGQVGMCMSTYSANGDFTPELIGTGGITPGSGYPGAIFSVIGANGKLVKNTAIGGQAQTTMSKDGQPANGFIGCYGTYTDSDNNFYAFGTVTGSNNQTLAQRVGFITKLSSTGNIIWEKAYGILENAQSSYRSTIYRLGETKDGNLVIAGETSLSETTEFPEKSNGGFDIFIAKVSKTDGSYVVSPKVYGGSGHERFPITGREVHQGEFVTDSDDNFYLDFNTDSPRSGDIKKAPKGGYDIGYFKFDANLNLVGDGRFGGSGNDYTRGMIESSTGTFVASVSSNSTDLPAAVVTKHAGANMVLVEVDRSFKLVGGVKFGGTGGNSKLAGLQISPSGDIVVAGTTPETTGDFADSGAGASSKGFAFNLDPTTYEIKNKFYYGAEMFGFVYTPTDGVFYAYANATSTDTTIGTIEGEFKDTGAGSDIIYSKFGPTSNTPAVINAKEHATVSIGETVDSKNVLNASIGDYDEFLDQSVLTATPATVDTKENKSFKITLSGAGAESKTGYIHVTNNKLPLINGKQLLDAASDITVLAGSNQTDKTITRLAKVSAWNIDTQEKYTTTIDATDLAAVNAVTTETTTVPVKVTIPATGGGVLTKIINVRVMTKENVIAEIKAEAETVWGGDQTEYAEKATQAIAVGVKTEEEIKEALDNNKKTSEEAVAELTTSLINVDTDGNGIADYNIDIDGDGTADINKDTNGDGKADTNKTQTTDPTANNYDEDGDGYPETNIDIDGDGTADLNIDVDGDKKPDVNIDIDGDKKPDINIDIDGDKKPDVNIDIDGDKKPDINIDIDGDKKPDINIDTDDDGEADTNIDVDGDKKPDVNIDIDGDKKPDINIDIDGDKKPDVNIDIDGDKKPDINIDIDGDKKPDINIDTDDDGEADTNIDVDGDGTADLTVFSRDYQMNLSHFSKATVFDHLNMSGSYVLDMNTMEKHYFDQVDVSKVPAQVGTYKVTFSFAETTTPTPAARSARVAKVLPTVTPRSLKATVNLTIVKDAPVVMPQTGTQNGVAYASVIVVMLAVVNLTLRKKLFK